MSRCLRVLLGPQTVSFSGSASQCSGILAVQEDLSAMARVTLPSLQKACSELDAIGCLFTEAWTRPVLRPFRADTVL